MKALELEELTQDKWDYLIKEQREWNDWLEKEGMTEDEYWDQVKEEEIDYDEIVKKLEKMPADFWKMEN